MSVIVKLTFPAGRYHATPWGRHVNEGVAEWPPSPWRLLRALVAVWKRTCPDIEEASVRRILGELSEPPRFSLPPHRVAHTRHYMPWEKKGPLDRTLVFDTFVCIDRLSPLFVGWSDAQLAASDKAALSRLLGNLSSLGRTESWIDARLTDADVDLEIGPAAQDESNPVPVLCADPLSAFSNEHYPRHDPVKLKKGQVKPADYLFDCPSWHLCLDTETIHAKRWSMVPGSKWVRYSRPVERRLTRTRILPKPDQKLVTCATLLLDGPVLPLVKDTVQIAEHLRSALMSVFNKCCRGRDEVAKYLREGDGRYASPTFAGKAIDGSRLPGHDHAHYLPLADKFDPRFVRQILVVAPGGFEALEIMALRRLREVNFDNISCRVQLVGLSDLQSSDNQIFGFRKTWISQTPFIAHRHAKTRGSRRDVPADPLDRRGSFLALAVREICQKRGLPHVVEATPVKAATGQLQFYEFRRARRKLGNDAYSRISGYLRIRFAEPVPGPICLGYNCHFGMGLFVPAADEAP